MIDFDEIDDWWPRLTSELAACVPDSAKQAIATAAPEYIEYARRRLFSLVDQAEVISVTLDWIRSTTIAVYHGSRLTDAEVESIRSIGLVPLQAEARRARLVRALSSHSTWSTVAGDLDAAIRRHGKGNRAGHREDQAHLTLSRTGLTDGFNHYLTHGSEFDQHVAHALLGDEGVKLLARDGEPRVIRFAVPGIAALDAAHPHFEIDHLLAKGEVPNIARQFIDAWSYRLAHPGFQSRTLEVDCGMVFRSTVSPGWIVSVDTLTDQSL